MPTKPPNLRMRPTPAKQAWDHGGRTRQQRGYGAAHDAIRAELLRDVIICEACARMTPPRVTRGVIADHIKPLAKGGSGARENYQLLCRRCADAKDAKDKGVTRRKRLTFGEDGWPIDD